MKLKFFLKRLTLATLPFISLYLIFAVNATLAYCLGTTDSNGDIIYFEGDDCI